MVKNLVITTALLILLSYGLTSFVKKDNSTAVSGALNINKTDTTEITATKNEYSLWLNWWSGDETNTTLNLLPSNVNSVSPLWYFVDANSDLREYKIRSKEAILDTISNNSLSIIPTVGNDFDPVRINKLLHNNQLKNSLINKLIDLVNENNFAGIDLDWEQVYEKDNEKYAEFVSELKARLTNRNKTVIVTVHAQTGVGDWEGSMGHNIELLSESADLLRIMAYDYHYSESAPGPTTPTDWLTRVVRYTANKVDNGKIVIGLPLYGYKWNLGASGESINYSYAKESEKKLGFKLSRDISSGVLNAKFMENNKKYEIWIDDSESVINKINLVNDMGFNKFIFWVAGGEDQLLWSNLPV